MLGRRDGEAEQRVDHPHRLRTGPQERRRRRDCRPEIVQELELAGGDPLLRAEDDRLPFFECGCDVPLAAGEGLLADVLLGQRRGVGVADLDVVAEDPVESDLQRADAGAPPLCRLETRDPVAGAARCVGDRVEVGVVAGLDHTAFSNARWRVLDERTSEGARQLRRRADLAGQVPRHQGRAGAQSLLHARNGLERAPQADELSRRSVALDRPRDEALEIADRLQRRLQAIPQSRRRHQLVHRRQAQLDRLCIAKGRAHPRAQLTRSDRG